jgi:hypothetical protein
MVCGNFWWLTPSIPDPVDRQIPLAGCAILSFGASPKTRRSGRRWMIDQGLSTKQSGRRDRITAGRINDISDGSHPLDA